MTEAGAVGGVLCVGETLYPPLLLLATAPPAIPFMLDDPACPPPPSPKVVAWSPTELTDEDEDGPDWEGACCSWSWGSCW